MTKIESKQPQPPLVHYAAVLDYIFFPWRRPRRIRAPAPRPPQARCGAYALGPLPPARFRAQRESEYGTRDSSASQLGWPCPNCQSKLVRAAIGTARGVFARLVPRIDPASSRWPAHSCVQLAPCIEQHSSTASRRRRDNDASHIPPPPRRHDKRQAPPPESTDEPRDQQKVLPPVPEMAKAHDQSSGAFNADERRGVVWAALFEGPAHRRPFPSRKCQGWFSHSSRRRARGFAIRVDRGRPPPRGTRLDVSRRPELRAVRRKTGHV